MVLDERLHPQVIAVASERARAIDLEVEVTSLDAELVGEDLVGVEAAYPGTEGDIADPRPVIEAIHDRGGLATVVADPLALMLLESLVRWVRTLLSVPPSVLVCHCFMVARMLRTWRSRIR